jgi:ribose transport system permease protein
MNEALEAPPIRERTAAARPRFVFTREMGLLGLILGTIVLFSILYPISFRSLPNVQAILRNMAVDGILAVGMMMLLVSGVFDLSVGSMLSMTGVMAGWLMKVQGWPVPAAVTAALLIAALGGFTNGFVVAKVKVNALITTLGTMGIFQGIAILLGGPGITFLPRSFTRLGQAEILGIQTPVWLMFGLALAAHYLLTYTRFFRQYYYIGSNAKAAALSGINVERVQMLAFTIMGVVAGIAGIAFASRVATAVSNAGVGAELRVITAVILGGASLTGGKGTIWGAMLGVTFVALVTNVLIIAKVSSEWQGIIMGIILVLAVATDSFMTRKTR